MLNTHDVATHPLSTDMRIILACIADHASTDALGKLSITGIFDNIVAQLFPARHLQLFLVMRAELSFSDNDRPHLLRVELVDEDGRQVGRVETSLIHDRLEPGQRVVVNQSLQLQNLIFQKPGRYLWRITAEDEEPVEVPFDVLLAGSQP